MRNAPLTSFQSSVFEFIKEYLANNGKSPTLREMARHFGRPSGGVFTHTIKVLAERDLILHTRGKWRGIAVVQVPATAAENLKRGASSKPRKGRASRPTEATVAIAM